MRKSIVICFVLLFSFLTGCKSMEGRMWSDTLQILLTQDGLLQWVICVLLIMALFQLFKIFGAGWRGIRWAWGVLWGIVFKPNWRNVLISAFLGTVLWVSRGVLVETLQDIEQHWAPVYVNEYSDIKEEHLTAIYEAELSKIVDPYEYGIITRRTHEIAAKIQSTPLAIYECAYMECGLNPYTVRRDQVAAGWIQFTRIGLQGWTYQNRTVRFEEVLTACKKRDPAFIMDITECYLTDKYERAGKRPLNNTIDLYLALFAPALIGSPSEKIVYQGFSNPSYYLNNGLDGWYQSDKNQIFRKNSQCDGKITIWEMYLALESRKARLIGRYMHR